jgi:hypothetical protein
MLDLWFMWKQSLTIGAGHFPSLFLNYRPAVFYPQYAFYGGTFYALTAGFSLVLGNAPIVTSVLSYLLAFAAAYGGWYWLARQAGLGRWQSHVPGLVFITSAYYLTMIYAEGEWPEFIAVSMIPLVMSAGLSILRADRLRMWPALALTSSCIFFAGSHVLTLVWGATAIVAVGLAIVICIPQSRQEISRRGFIRLAGLAIPALLVSAWFLVPAAAYESSTWIASEYPTWRSVLRSTMWLMAIRHIFTLSRSPATPTNPGLALSLPILVMAWTFVSVVLALAAGLRGPWMRFLLICTSFTALMIILMTHAGLILALPRFYATVQYAHRLEPYALLGLSGAVLCSLVLAKGKIRALRPWTQWALPPILAIGMIGAIQQAAGYPATTDRDAEVASWSIPLSPSEDRSYETTSAEATSASGVFIEYVDVHQPILTGAEVHQSILNGSEVHPPVLKGSLERLPLVHFDTTSELGAGISTELHLYPGELVNSNLFGSPGLVHVTGARIVGINDGDGADVLEVDPASPSSRGRGTSARAGTISVSPSASFPVVLGRVLTLCAVTALLLQFGLLAVRRRKHAT